MKTLNVLAVDLGASNGRGIMGRFDGGRLGFTEVHRFNNPMFFINESCFWDILYLYDETKTCVGKACRINPGDVSSVGIDGWAQDFGLLDGQGNLLGNIHTYRDPRWEGMAEALGAKLPPEEFYGITGMFPMNVISLFQLMGLRERERSIYDAAKTFLFIPDLMNYFLTANVRCNVTLAGLSGLYDIKARSWSKRIIEAAGFPDLFPSIGGTCEQIGNIGNIVSGQLGVGKIPVISVAAHDTMSALAFAPGRDKNSLLISSGTWSGFGYHKKEPLFNEGFLRNELVNEIGFDHEILIIRNITGLWIVQELYRGWGEIPDYETLGLSVSQNPYAGYIDVDAPEFASPGNMEEKIIRSLTMTGQPLPESKNDFYLCVLSSIAMKYRRLTEVIEAYEGKRFEYISVVGGGSKNKALNALTANICNKRVIAGPAEATAIGNMLCQLIALREVGTREATEVAMRSFELTEISPENVNYWEDQYYQYSKIYGDNK